MRVFYYGLGFALLGALTGTAAQFRGLGEGITIQAISGNGRVAVGSTGTNSSTTSYSGYPFRWNCGQTATYKIFSAGYEAQRPGAFLGVSEDGNFMVGTFLGARQHAFLWNFDSDSEDLGYRAVASGVADNGIVAGTLYPGNTITTRAARWPGGSLGTLTTNNTFESTAAAAITPDGTTIVGSSTPVGPGIEGQPFKWTEQTGMVGLGTLQGFLTYGTDVSADGNVVVGYGTVYTNGFYSRLIFRWTATEGMSALASPQSYSGTQDSQSLRQVAADGDGSTIVGTIIPSPGSPPEAFIWNATDGIRNLKIILEEKGLDLSGWSLSSAVDISRNGNVIIGNGANSNGNAEAWIAVLDESFPPFESCPRQPLLTGLITANTNIMLQWPADTNATGFKLQRKIGTNTWTALAHLSGFVTNFNDYGIFPGESRSYRIAATNAIDYSLYSDEVNLVLPTGTFEFSQTSAIAGENQSFVTIGVSRISGSDGTATIDFSTVNGTAIAGEDYVSTNGTLVFTNGQTLASFIVEILPDNLSEFDEYLLLQLSNPAVGTTLGSRSQIALTITNVPIGQIHFAQGSYSVSEDADQVLVSVIRTNGNAGNVSVHFATHDGSALAGSDYVATNGILSFTNGQSSHSLAIQILNDQVLEEREAFEITLYEAFGTTLGSPTVAYVGIEDDDISIGFTADLFSVSELVSSALISVIRVGDTNRSATVDFLTTDGSATGGLDYTPTAATLIFAPGETVKYVTIAINQDELDEEDETINLTLHSPSSGVSLSISTAQLQIRERIIVSECTEDAIRAAIAEGGRIKFECDGTILLTETITISTNTTLDGNGRSVTISGGNSVRLFLIKTDTEFSVLHLTISDGRMVGNTNETSSGGGIRNMGTLKLHNSILSNNISEGYSTDRGGAGIGGAIGNSGRVFATNTTFILNQAIGGRGLQSTPNLTGGEGLGGAIAGGEITLVNCSFLTNSAQGGRVSSDIPTTGVRRGGNASGGAIYSSGGIVTLSHSIFSGNFAQGGITEPDCISDSAAGGAIVVSSGSITMLNCELRNNYATGRGSGPGAIYLDGANGYFESCLFLENASIGPSACGEYSTGGAAGGGAVKIDRSSSHRFVNCQFVRNTAIGGSGNTPETCGTAEGGAIHTTHTSWLTLSSCNFTENSVTGGRAFGGAISTSSSANEYFGTTFSNNSVIAKSGEGGGGAVMRGTWCFLPPQCFHGGIHKLIDCSFSSNSVKLHGKLSTNDFAPGSGVTFSVLGSASSHYSWFFEDTEISSSADSSFTRYNLTSFDAGAYSVSFISDISLRQTLTTAVGAPPSIVASPQTQFAALGEHVVFTIAATG
ncbi:MAG: Calx-beta domain-containing protein [Limisphaerales bacterium]